MIVSAGDSFIFGSELQSPNNTFTALLGATDCIAQPGYGNSSIARSVIEKCEQQRPIAVIVSWTFPTRYEFRFNYLTGQKSGHWYVINPWTAEPDLESIQQEFVTYDDKVLADQLNTLRRANSTGIADFAKTYYKHLSSEYWETYNTLKEIVYLQNYLKVNKIPYLFTCADNCIWYNHTVDNPDSNIQSLVNQIEKDQENWFWFPPGANPQDTCKPRGFYQWAVENKYKVGTTHPLEEAHLDASKLMQEKFDEMV